MFNPISYIKSVFVVVVIFLVIIAATRFSSPVKDTVAGVLGTQIEENSQTLPRELQKDVNASVESAKDTALQTDMKDFLNYQAKINKVVADYHTVQREIQEKVDEFFSEKKD